MISRRWYQPSLTNAIKALETEMGGELFNRSPVTRITDLSLAVKPYFEEILLNVEHARKCAQIYNGGENRRLDPNLSME